QTGFPKILSPMIPMTLDQTIHLVGALGTWVAGVGSLAAVIVALWLARRSSRVRLKCRAGIRLLIEQGISKEILSFSVTNVGERPVIITNIISSNGKGKNRIDAVMLLDSKSAQYNTPLAYGQNAHFYIDLSDKTDFITQFTKDFIQPEIGRKVNTLRFLVHTSVDHIEKVIPQKSFLDRLAS
ncbi:MAG: hypothetical protein OXF46_10735, partial [Rhodobacteraceae bacterium]|nr:hypothetical protein [Paracoccaceae bacterium]